MNADFVLSWYERQGEVVTLRRQTGRGKQRVPFDVKCIAHVKYGTARVLVGDIQQTGDEIKLTDREMNANRWPKPPRHGDVVIYADGTQTAIQGRAKITRLEDDIVYTITALGG